MKKNYVLPLMMVSMFAITGCNNKDEKTVVNKAPAITGVKDFTCGVNSTIDFLDGVAALDKEDGDITDKMSITISNGVTQEDGIATFREPGSYTVTYKVTDSGERETTKYCYVDVVEREKYREFKLPEGFQIYSSDKAVIEHCGMYHNEFRISGNSGNVNEDVQISNTIRIEAEKEHTFRIKISNRKQRGKISAKIDGKLVAETMLNAGENEFVFNYTANGTEGSKTNIKLTLCLGGIGEQFDLTINSIDYSFPQTKDEEVVLNPGFSFMNNVDRRFDTAEGRGSLVGNAFDGSNGKEAVLEVDQACNAGWAGGMFVFTGVQLQANCKYKAKFETDAKNTDYEICFRKNQWAGNTEYWKTRGITNGEHEIEFTTDSNGAGFLWIYICSGDVVNRVAFSKLQIIEVQKEIGYRSVRIEDFNEETEGIASQDLYSEYGYVRLHVNKFEYGQDAWGRQKLYSPNFHLNGSVANYGVTFKMRSDEPIEVVCAGPIMGAWNPSVFWKKLYINNEVQTFTFFFEGKGMDEDHRIEWQFAGSLINEKVENIDIEITDMSIILRDAELDG